MLAPLALLLMKLPFLSNAKQAVAAPTPAVGTLSGKLGTISLFVVGMLIPAIIFPARVRRQSDRRAHPLDALRQ